MTRVRTTVIRQALAYGIALAIGWYAARGVSWEQVVEAGSGANLWLFVVSSLGGFLCLFAGETVLYSRLFSYFHRPTKAFELLPTMAAVYFLQIVNSYVASGAFVLFLHVRKRVPWLKGVGTLVFQGYVDAMLLVTLSLFAIALVPMTPIRPGLIYAAGALAAGCLIVTFWLFWGGRLRPGNWLRWVYDRPSMETFRMARPPHYATLLAIRSVIVLGVGLGLYGQLVSFDIDVPLIQTLALTPVFVAIGTSPFSPGGIGTTQLVFTMGFAQFAGKDELFALSLAVTAFNLIARIPMGFALGGPLVEEAAEVTSEFSTARAVG